MKQKAIRASIHLPRELRPAPILEGIEAVVGEVAPAKPRRRLSLDTPLIPPAGRKLGMTNEELCELIEFP